METLVLSVHYFMVYYSFKGNLQGGTYLPREVRQFARRLVHLRYNHVKACHYTTCYHRLSTYITFLCLNICLNNNEIQFLVPCLNEEYNRESVNSEAYTWFVEFFLELRQTQIRKLTIAINNYFYVCLFAKQVLIW